jgi:hypothetical protein
MSSWSRSTWKPYSLLSQGYPIHPIDSSNEEKSFNAKYETLTPNVVPRSSQKLAQDEEFTLFAVTLFRRDIPEFSHRCREYKFVFSVYC